MKIKYSKLSTKDLGILAQRVLEHAKQSDIEQVKTHLFLSSLEASYNEYYAVVAKQTFSGKGQTVAQADKERDKAFSQLKAFLSGYSRVTSAPHHADAVALYNLFKIYGLHLDKLSYGEQTLQLGKLIEELSSTENQNRITNLSLQTAFNNLKTTHEDFKSSFDEQAQANAELRERKSASSLRKSLEKDLRRFLDLVTLMNDAGQWTDLYSKLNEFVKAAKG